MSDNITYEIVEHLGVISKGNKGWQREFNLVKWNGADPKYDIRDWDQYHEKMAKGLTFYEGEVRKIVDLFLESKNRLALEQGKKRQEEKSQRRQDEIERRRSDKEELERREELEKQQLIETIEPTETADDFE